MNNYENILWWLENARWWLKNGQWCSDWKEFVSHSIAHATRYANQLRQEE